MRWFLICFVLIVVRLMFSCFVRLVFWVFGFVLCWVRLWCKVLLSVLVCVLVIWCLRWVRLMWWMVSSCVS